MLVYCSCVWVGLVGVCVHFSLLIQLVGSRWLTFYPLFFLSPPLFSRTSSHLVSSSSLAVLRGQIFTFTFLLLLRCSPHPLVDPSDCRVKLWSYVPGLTPCLPRRVLAIKGRATSLPWLPLLCSPTLLSSGTLLTNFHLPVPAVCRSPCLSISSLVFPGGSLHFAPVLLLYPFHFCSNDFVILFFRFV